MYPRVAVTPKPTPRHPKALPILAVDYLAKPPILMMQETAEAM